MLLEHIGNSDENQIYKLIILCKLINGILGELCLIERPSESTLVELDIVILFFMNSSFNTVLHVVLDPNTTCFWNLSVDEKVS